MACGRYNGQKYRLQLKQKEIKSLDGEYRNKARHIESNFELAGIMKKINILLAIRSVQILQKEIVEKMLFRRLAKGRTEEIKMPTERKRLIEYEIEFLQDMIWKYEGIIYDLFKEIPQNDPQRDKIKEKLDKEKIHDWPNGVEDTGPFLIDSSPFSNIMYNIVKREIYFHMLIAIEKQRVELFKTPRSDEYEKICLAYFSNKIKDVRAKHYESMCWIYFRELPIDHPHRQKVKKLILGPHFVFSFVINRMLYDSAKDSYAVWSNFHELTSPDRELQIIVETLDRKYTSRQILRELDITSIIQHITELDPTLSLKYANEIIGRIPPDIFEQRKELFEEIIKVEYWKYVHCNYTFELTSWANMTTLNSNDTYERNWDKF
jgi:hypothetical protein